MVEVAGWAHSRFGKLSGVSVYDLVKEVKETLIKSVRVEPVETQAG